MNFNAQKNISKCLNTYDMAKRAKKFLPKVIFDYVEGGTDDEYCLNQNEKSFLNYKFIPRYLADTTIRNKKACLLGQTYALPFGIAPMGAMGIIRHEADVVLAQAAQAKNVPFILSGASHASMERVCQAAPGSWLQFYPCKSLEIEADLLRRATACGVRHLVVTLDVPLHSNRERSVRSGWVRPYKPTLPLILDGMQHPAWAFNYMRHGLPKMENFVPYAAERADAREITNVFSQQLPGRQDLDLIRRIRQQWQGHLIIKGILSPEDAITLQLLGVNGIIVSNHGGRQLDKSIAALDALPGIVQAVGNDLTVMFDSGIRRGSDIALALCLGAKFCFVGRPFAYGLAAFGAEGVERVMRILEAELDLTMGQIGAARISALNADLVHAAHTWHR